MPGASDPISIAPEALLAHAEWVRVLAAQLVSDPATAQDVEQEVWVRTLENPPRTSANLRGWLGAVARNVARQFVRRESRRASRETTAAKPEATVDSAELVAEAEQQRQLVGEVLALDEPYRTAILLRYFREMPPAEIARSLEIPRNTVRTRLARGLEELRSALDRRHGSRKGWIAAFAIFRRRATSGPTMTQVTSAGVAIAAAKLVAALSLVGLLGWVTWKVLPGSHESTDIRLASSLRQGAQASADGASVDSGRTEPSRIPIAAAPRESLPREQGGERASTSQLLSGRLVDLAGKSVPGLPVEWVSWEMTRVTVGSESTELCDGLIVLLREDPQVMDELVRKGELGPALCSEIRARHPVLPKTKSGEDGSITLTVQGTLGQLRSADTAATIAGEGTSPSGESVWFVAASQDLYGEVVDEKGEPVAEANIRVKGSLHASGAVPPSFEVKEDAEIATVTDEAGRFLLKRIPKTTGKWLVARKDGFEDGELEIEGKKASGSSVVVHMRHRAWGPIRGVVVHGDGSPAPGSLVRYGKDSAGSDKQGRFRLERTTGEKPAAIVATLRGYQPARISGFDPDSFAAGDDVRLVLGPTSVSISGRVLRPDGVPCTECCVALRDDPASCIVYGDIFVNGNAHWGSRALSPFVNVDADGRFLLDELSSVSYSLMAFDPNTGAVVDLADVLGGGSPVEIRMPDGDYCTRVRGRLVTCRGEALPDVEVQAGFRMRNADGASVYLFVATGETDQEGRFHLDRVPRQRAVLQAIATDLEMSDTPVPENGSREVQVVADTKGKLHVDFEDARSTDELEVRDHEGEPLEFTLPRRESSKSVHRCGIGTASTFDCVVSCRAETMVLLREGQEIRRVSVEIRRGASSRVRL